MRRSVSSPVQRLLRKRWLRWTFPVLVTLSVAAVAVVAFGSWGGGGCGDHYREDDDSTEHHDRHMLAPPVDRFSPYEAALGRAGKLQVTSACIRA